MNKLLLLAAAGTLALTTGLRAPAAGLAPHLPPGRVPRPCLQPAEERIQVTRNGDARPGEPLSLSIAYTASPAGGTYAVWLAAPAGALGDPPRWVETLAPGEHRERTVSVRLDTPTAFPLAARIHRSDPGFETRPPAEDRIWIVPATGAHSVKFSVDPLDEYRRAVPPPETLEIAPGLTVVVLRCSSR